MRKVDDSEPGRVSAAIDLWEQEILASEQPAEQREIYRRWLEGVSVYDFKNEESVFQGQAYRGVGLTPVDFSESRVDRAPQLRPYRDCRLC